MTPTEKALREALVRIAENAERVGGLGGEWAACIARTALRPPEAPNEPPALSRQEEQHHDGAGVVEVAAAGIAASTQPQDQGGGATVPGRLSSAGRVQVEPGAAKESAAPAPTAGLQSLFGAVSFLRSCLRSGEALSAAEDAAIDAHLDAAERERDEARSQLADVEAERDRLRTALQIARKYLDEGESESDAEAIAEINAALAGKPAEAPALPWAERPSTNAAVFHGPSLRLLAAAGNPKSEIEVIVFRPTLAEAKAKAEQIAALLGVRRG